MATGESVLVGAYVIGPRAMRYLEEYASAVSTKGISRLCSLLSDLARICPVNVLTD